MVEGQRFATEASKPGPSTSDLFAQLVPLKALAVWILRSRPSCAGVQLAFVTADGKALPMLQAIVKNKARYFLFKGFDKRPTEDIVTDCVFGGLRYLQPDDAGRVLSWLAPDRSALRDARVVSVDLWKRAPDGCEPDALLKCVMADGSILTIIVEAKWQNYGLAKGQAIRQWRAVGEVCLRHGEEALHLFVVGSRSKAAMLADDDEDLDRLSETELRRGWQDRRDVLLWHDVAARLKRRPRTGSEQLHRWAEDVVAVLQELGERPFDGFRQSIDVPREITFTLPVFYSGPAVSRKYQWPDAIVAPCSGK